jgi:hypothetical protein
MTVPGFQVSHTWLCAADLVDSVELVELVDLVDLWDPVFGRC